MKTLFLVNRSTQAVDIALLVVRIAIAALMLSHGLPKLTMLFSGDPIQFPGVLGMSPVLSLALVVFAEVFCSILLLVGFVTRLAVIPLIITMLVAVFIVHGADPFVRKEPGLQYLISYMVLAIAGSGRYSIDAILQARWIRSSFAKASV
jgi:putative oxidoreductase